jgi:hypothetical protein
MRLLIGVMLLLLIIGLAESMFQMRLIPEFIRS